MCGLVRKPTDKRTFPRDKLSTLIPRTRYSIIAACEEVHIPEIATRAVLLFANHIAYKKDFVFLSIPFALYEDGKRFVTEETVSLEEAVMHLAMAGSVRHHINKELSAYGLLFELGHCCDIQMHERARNEEAMMRSHDGNTYRADKLRLLKKGDEEVIPLALFLEKIKDLATKEVAELVFTALFHKEAA